MPPIVTTAAIQQPTQASIPNPSTYYSMPPTSMPHPPIQLPNFGTFAVCIFDFEPPNINGGQLAIHQWDLVCNFKLKNNGNVGWNFATQWWRQQHAMVAGQKSAGWRTGFCAGKLFELEQYSTQTQILILVRLISW